MALPRRHRRAAAAVTAAAATAAAVAAATALVVAVAPNTGFALQTARADGTLDASCSRRTAAAGAAAATLATGPFWRPAWAAEEVEVTQAQLGVGMGATAEELVLPKFFVGEWAVVAQLYQVEAGKGGERALNAAFPRAGDALKGVRDAMGTADGDFVARRRWQATSKQVPGSPEGDGGALEDADGVSVGVFAAAQALAGRSAPIQPRTDGAVEIGASGGIRFQLRAAGATGRPDPTLGDGGFRINELFEAKTIAGASVEGEPAIRISTYWKRVQANLFAGKDAKGLPDSAEAGFGMGKADPSRPYFLQAVQVVYLLSDPTVPSDSAVATYTTRFLYSPILPTKG
mmetsp:Transcript_79838/g.258710  ORF Transcript_79838/g.258710 Transcript_79838/m.258710 type:complete len:345 (-) Transcript_79838:130-1164(-)